LVPFHASSFRVFFPFLFLAVVVLVAIRFGTLAGVLGTIAAAIIFAGFLFEPRLSLAVRDTAAKSNLIWMIIGGVAISDLLGHRSKTGTSR
jgi:K+-sensing histidine kinase KdpD